MTRDHYVVAKHPNAAEVINGVRFEEHEDNDDWKVSRKITAAQAEAFRGVPHFEVHGPDGAWGVTAPVAAVDLRVETPAERAMRQALGGVASGAAAAPAAPPIPQGVEFVAERRLDGSFDIYTASGAFLGHYVDADKARPAVVEGLGERVASPPAQPSPPASFGEGEGEGDGDGDAEPAQIAGLPEEATADEVRRFAESKGVHLDARFKDPVKMRRTLAATLAQRQTS